MKRAFLFCLYALAVIILCACNTGKSNLKQDEAAKAVEAYLQALVSQDSVRVASLSCSTWEEQARSDLESFSAVKSSIDGLACKVAGQDGQNTLVNCTGKIIANYNGENQEIDLSARTYQAVQDGGQWLMCGYK
jgi:hypothetical protein